MKRRFCFSLALLCALTALAATESPDASNDPVVLAVQKVVPAVVNVNTERLSQRGFSDPFDELFRQFFGQPRSERGQSLGSGVIVDEDGWIVTNFHVVRRATKINVVLSDGSQYEARYVSGNETNDLALLKIDVKKPLPFVEIAADGEPLLGESVIAVGNPFGLDHTVTKGIISAKNRKYDANGQMFEDILQTDAAINPGNSGGPLVNLRGQLVGINMAMLSQAEGIGFAIPAKRVAGMLSGWLSPEKRSRVWLGLQFDRQSDKLVITDVQSDSPAAKAGLAARDVVAAVDDKAFGDVLLLQRHLLHKKANDTVKFAVERDGKRRDIEVTLTALPKLSATDMMFKKFGLNVQELTPELADALGVAYTKGLLVSAVQKGSAADEEGLRRGVVVTHIGGEEFANMDRLAEQLAGIKTGDEVIMAVVFSERRPGVLFQQTTSKTLKAR